MGEIAEINGIDDLEISQVNGVARSSIDNIFGHTFPAAAVTIFSTTFDSDTGSTDGGATMPTGWARSYNNSWTIYGSTTTYSATNTNRFWVTGWGRTGSNYTGPGGGMDDGIDATSGEWTSTSSQRYLYYEASVPASNTSVIRRAMVRTGALDFSSYSTITMTFWFHMYGKPNSNTGGGTDRMGKLGIAATTSATDASDASEAGSGLGFTSDDAGGCTILSWTTYNGSATQSGTRISGTQQGSGNTASLATNNYWRKATIDLSGAAGESTVYIYFLAIAQAAASSWGSDMSIDNIKIVGS